MSEVAAHMHKSAMATDLNCRCAGGGEPMPARFVAAAHEHETPRGDGSVLITTCTRSHEAKP